MKLLPLQPDSKIPFPGHDWHLDITDDPETIAEWKAKGFNLGMPLEENGRVVVDYDDREAGERFMREYPELCTVIVETRRGLHFYFSGATKTRKFPHGDIKGNGYVVAPSSVVDGHRYRFIAQGQLQPFPEALFPPMQATRNGVAAVTRNKVKNLDAYLAKIESVQGKNGSAGLMRAAYVCRDAGCSEAEATIALLKWNNGPTVSPPWSDTEIARAVTRAFCQGAKK